MLRTRVLTALLIVVTLVVFLLGGLITEGWHLRDAFYEAVAQVMPVLLLVAAVEGRFFAERKPALATLGLRWYLYVALAGEACALGVLARGGESAFLRGGVLAGLTAVLALFLVFALEGPLPSKDDRPA